MTIPKIYPLCETALVIEWGYSIDDAIHQQVLHLNKILNLARFTGFVETVPAYATLTIYYQPELTEHPTPFLFVKKIIEELLLKLPVEELEKEEFIPVPVCYDEEFGYDLEFVAMSHDISKEKVIALHQETAYKVYMMGFLPGFAYMGKLGNAIATARKPTPSARVEAGSVGIAGNQTGLYPLASPGGWQIIGRTPLCLFDLQKENPFLFKTGNRVKFHAISKEEFYKIKNEEAALQINNEDINMAEVVVVKPGIFSTLQDGGRFGFQSYGVPISGAMDLLAHFIANALAGNLKTAATIECTMGGLLLQFRKNAVIAITGGGAVFINGQKIKAYQPLSVAANDLLEIRYNNDGFRTYIAARGGFSAAVVMNSKSVCIRAGIGSVLKKEDRLQFDTAAAAMIKRITKNLSIPVYAQQIVIRVVDGAEKDWMSDESNQRVYSQNFRLSNQCDRMGYHLNGEALSLKNTTEMLSTAVTKGTVQLTPGGQLIILMSDCQTTGGYPRVAQIAAVDLPVLAQLKPGDIIRFTNISFEEAESLYLTQQKKINEFFGGPEL